MNPDATAAADATAASDTPGCDTNAATTAADDTATDARTDRGAAVVGDTETEARTETEAGTDLDVESAPVAGGDGALLRSGAGRGAAPLVRGIGYAYTSHGQAWPVRDMLASIGDQARWVTVFCSKADGVLAYGTERRYATRAQVEALIGRDHGCSFPGCQMPPQWCEAHHVIPAIPKHPCDRPGPTDLTNLTPLCGYHHRHFEQAGWHCHMINGQPWWRPPAHLDPDRTPRRNTRWDLPYKR